MSNKDSVFIMGDITCTGLSSDLQMPRSQSSSMLPSHTQDNMSHQRIAFKGIRKIVTSTGPGVRPPESETWPAQGPYIGCLIL